MNCGRWLGNIEPLFDKPSLSESRQIGGASKPFGDPVYNTCADPLESWYLAREDGVLMFSGACPFRSISTRNRSHHSYTEIHLIQVRMWLMRPTFNMPSIKKFKKSFIWVVICNVTIHGQVELWLRVRH